MITGIHMKLLDRQAQVLVGPKRGLKLKSLTLYEYDKTSWYQVHLKSLYKKWSTYYLNVDRLLENSNFSGDGAPLGYSAYFMTGVYNTGP